MSNRVELGEELGPLFPSRCIIGSRGGGWGSGGVIIGLGMLLKSVITLSHVWPHGVSKIKWLNPPEPVSKWGRLSTLEIEAGIVVTPLRLVVGHAHDSRSRIGLASGQRRSGFEELKLQGTESVVIALMCRRVNYHEPRQVSDFQWDPAQKHAPYTAPLTLWNWTKPNTTPTYNRQHNLLKHSQYKANQHFFHNNKSN